MPVDPARAVGAELPAGEFEWDEDRVILYHLGLGAGMRSDDGELAYCYEAQLKVLPTFATVPLFPDLFAIGGVDGIEVNLASALHGEHTLTLHRPLPTSGRVNTKGRIEAIYDKGRHAVVVAALDSEDAVGPLFSNRATIVLRGEGGFGGEPGPAGSLTAPDRDPEAVVEVPTLRQQALLYRLSGDKNPLHADPAFAAFAGYERPIMHGLCSYGIACKAVVDSLLGGDTTRLGSFTARFSGVAYPGETLQVRIWAEADGVALQMSAAERAAPVLAGEWRW
jgi:acyl dehydratase